MQLDSYVPGQYNSDNVIENNIVDMNRGIQTTGVLSGISDAENTEGNTIRGNTVMNAMVGIQQGMQGPATETLAGVLAGICSGGAGTPGPAGRPCESDFECLIDELGDTLGGTCSGATSAGDDPRPTDTVIENNVVSNSVEGISAQTALGFLTIRGNSISGATRGMNLGGSALNSGTLVMRNSLSGNGNGLFLTNPVTANLGPSATSFEAQVTLNDITLSSLRAIGKNGSTPTTGYTLNLTELSVLGSGNHWGRTSCPGFIPGVDSPASFIVDSYPYITPVAATGNGTQCP